MWKGQLASAVRRFAKPSAAGAAVSLIVLGELDRRATDDQQEESSLYNHPQEPSLAPSSRSLLPLMFSPQMWLGDVETSCEGKSFMGKFKKVSGLARHQTIRRIEDTSTRETLDSRYSVPWGKPLGEGSFGAVYLATDRKTGEKVALKKISKKYTDDVSFQREMNALLHLRTSGGHPNICGLREQFNEGDHYYLILDLVSGGEMFDHLVKMGPYSEADAARLVREVASALAFIHGMDCVHGDLKPENVMLSSENPSDAVIKLVDFGCAQVTAEDSAFKLSRDLSEKSKGTGHTPAYTPPEVLAKKRGTSTIDPSFDMWALGIILYIMLCGAHPFDLEGNLSDQEITRLIVNKELPPIKNSPMTSHLSPSAIDLIQKLINWNPKRRITASEMLEHPWVRGETASQKKMAGSDKKLSTYRVFKSGLERQVFADMCDWSNKNNDDESNRTSLIERSFHKFDPQHKGYITTKDLRKLTQNGKGKVTSEKDEAAPLSLSGFEDLLSENMKNKYFPKGHVIYREGSTGNHMYFLNSGTVEVTTKAGTRALRKQGDFFGEGALFDHKKMRSATVKFVTPIHVIEISREYFDKYIASSEMGLGLNLREKDKTRKRNRAKRILNSQKNLSDVTFKKGEYLFKVGDEAKEVFILTEGRVDVFVEDHVVFTVRPNDVFGEHSLLFSRPRNVAALCVSDECKLHSMQARDFNAFLNASPTMRESLQEMALRREFQKAIVFKTKKAFPSEQKDLRAAFDAADEDSSGFLSLENVRSMIKRMDPTLTEKEVQSILKALDLDESGDVCFEEFARIFQANEAAASI